MKEQINKYIRENLAIDDQETIDMLIDSYQESLTASLKDIKQAVSSRDPQKLRAAGHALKGCSAGIGCEPIRELALRLEYAGRDSDFAAADEALPQLLAVAATL